MLGPSGPRSKIQVVLSASGPLNLQLNMFGGGCGRPPQAWKGMHVCVHCVHVYLDLQTYVCSIRVSAE